MYDKLMNGNKEREGRKVKGHRNAISRLDASYLSALL
jgi:hypothetical protein